MSAATAISLSVFAALWAAPSYLVWRWRKRVEGRRFVAWMVALYTCVFIAAAWYWRTPLREQKGVSELAYASDPASMGIGCAEMTAAAAKFEKASDGELDFADDGSVLVRASVWSALDPQQRESFVAFAEKLNNCLGTRVDRTVVKDIQNGAALD